MTEHFTRPDTAAFLAFLDAQEGPEMHEVSAVESREMMLAMGAIADAPTGDLAVIRDISIPGPAGDIPARIYDAQEKRGAGPVMVFYHGGGFVIGNLDTHEPYCAEVARQLDIPVISIDYRLAPEHPFPAASDDCEAATRWIATSPTELGYDVTGLIPSGDSAGGNLAIVTTMALRDNPADVPVIIQHPLYPAVSGPDQDWQSEKDFAEGYLLTAQAMSWFMEAYKPESDYRGAPLDFDQTGMPPTVITTASLDPLHDQGIAYAEKLREAGVPVEHISAEGNIHGYANLRQAIPSSNEDIGKAMDAVKKMLAEVTASA